MTTTPSERRADAFEVGTNVPNSFAPHESDVSVEGSQEVKSGEGAVSLPYAIETLSIRGAGRVTACRDVSDEWLFANESGCNDNGSLKSRRDAAWRIDGPAIVLAKTGGVIEFWTSGGYVHGNSEDHRGNGCNEDVVSDDDESTCSGNSESFDGFYCSCTALVDGRVEGLCPLSYRPAKNSTTIPDKRNQGTSHRVLYIVATTQAGGVFLLVLRLGICLYGALRWSMVVIKSVSTLSGLDNGEERMRFAAPPEPFFFEDSISHYSRGTNMSQACSHTSTKNGGYSPVSDESQDQSQEINSEMASAHTFHHGAALIPLVDSRCILVQLGANSEKDSQVSLAIDLIPSFPLPPALQFWVSMKIKRLIPLRGTFDANKHALICAHICPLQTTRKHAEKCYEDTIIYGKNDALVCFALQRICCHLLKATKEKYVEDRQSNKKERKPAYKYQFFPGPFFLHNLPTRFFAFPSHQENFWDELFNSDPKKLQHFDAMGKSLFRKEIQVFGGTDEGVLCVTATKVMFCSHLNGIQATSSFFSRDIWIASSNKPEKPCQSQNDAQFRLVGVCPLPLDIANGMANVAGLISTSVLVHVSQWVQRKKCCRSKHFLFLVSLVWIFPEERAVPSLNVQEIGYCDESKKVFDKDIKNVSACMIATKAGTIMLGSYVGKLSRLSCESQSRTVTLSMLVRLNEFSEIPLPIWSAATIPSRSQISQIYEAEISKDNEKRSRLSGGQVWHANDLVSLVGGVDLSACDPGLLGSSCSIHCMLSIDIGLGSTCFFRSPLTCLSPRFLEKHIMNNGQDGAWELEECLFLFTSSEATLVLACLFQSNLEPNSDQTMLPVQLEPVCDPLRSVGINPSQRTLAACSVNIFTLSLTENTCVNNNIYRIMCQVTSSRVTCHAFNASGIRTTPSRCNAICDYNIKDDVRIEQATLYPDYIENPNANEPCSSSQRSTKVCFGSSKKLLLCALFCSDRSLRLIEVSGTTKRDGNSPIFSLRVLRRTHTRLSNFSSNETGTENSYSNNDAIIHFDHPVSAMCLYSVQLDYFLNSGSNQQNRDQKYFAFISVAHSNGASLSVYGVKMVEDSVAGCATVGTDLLKFISSDAMLSSNRNMHRFNIEVSALEFIPQCYFRSGSNGCSIPRIVVGLSNGNVGVLPQLYVRAKGAVKQDNNCQGDSITTMKWCKVGYSPPHLQRTFLGDNSELRDEVLKEMKRCGKGALYDFESLSTCSYAVVASCTDGGNNVPSAALFVMLTFSDGNTNKHDTGEYSVSNLPNISITNYVSCFLLAFHGQEDTQDQEYSNASYITILPYGPHHEKLSCWMSNSGGRLNIGVLNSNKSYCSMKQLSGLSKSGLQPAELTIKHLCVLKTCTSGFSEFSPITLGVGVAESNEATQNIALFGISNNKRGGGPLWKSGEIPPDKKIIAIKSCSCRTRVQYATSSQEAFKEKAMSILEYSESFQREQPCVVISVSEKRCDENGKILVNDSSSTFTVLQLVADTTPEGIVYSMQGIASISVNGICSCLDATMDDHFFSAGLRAPAFCAGVAERISVFQWSSCDSAPTRFSVSEYFSATFGSSLGDINLAYSEVAPHQTAISAVSCAIGKLGIGDECCMFIAIAQLLHSISVYRFHPSTCTMKLYAFDFGSSLISTSILLSIFPKKPDMTDTYHPKVFVVTTDQATDTVLVFSTAESVESDKAIQLPMSTVAKWICPFKGERLCHLLWQDIARKTFFIIGSEGSVASAYLRRNAE